MRLYILVFSLMLLGNLSASVTPSKISPLSGGGKFIVYYVFDGKSIEMPLKEAMIKHLQKEGEVFKPGEDKYQTEGTMIYVIATPLIEKQSNKLSNYKELPVYELSVKAVAGVKVEDNGSQFPGTIWEKVQFIGTASENKDFVQKAVKGMDSILDSFIADYRKANPTEKKNKPQFFLYAP